MSSIYIIDYGMGNLRSIAKAFESLSLSVQITSNPEHLKKATAIILPGVGAFGVAMQNLEKSGMIPMIKNHIESGTPFLGICLGLQMLFETGFEKGTHQGLGILKGSVQRFESANTRIPHMGWNSVASYQLPVAGKKAPDMFSDIPENSLFYFVHSYFAEATDQSIVSGWCDYGKKFTASIQKGNIWATQFHPEKSGTVGLQLLKNFAEFANG